MPAHDRDHLPRSSFTQEDRNSLLMPPVLLVGGAFLAGVCLMALVNRAELAIIVSQFARLWPIAQNRQEVLRVCFKMLLTGVIFAAIALACHQVASTLRGAQQEEQEEAMQQDSSHLPSQLIHPPSAVPPGTREQQVVSLTSAPHHQSVKQTQPSARIPQPETVFLGAAATNKETVEAAASNKEARLPEEVEPSEHAPSAHRSVAVSEHTPPALITMTLLKTITMTLHPPGSSNVYPVVLDDLNAKALQLIAYVAWRRGKKVNLADMRNDVFGRDDLDLNQVQESLNSAKRDIRLRIRQAVERARSEMGEEAFPGELDVFMLAKKRYWLPEYVEVTDLALLEKQHRIIEEAEASHRLINAVPQDVYHACKRLIGAYTGDFLEDLLKSDPYSFDPAHESWAREPFTQFRDYYLDAILFAAEYERKAGDETARESLRREHYAEAASLFVRGAMRACNQDVFDGLFDTKVTFSSKPSSRQHGAHVLLSEQFIRRAIALYGKGGNTIVAKRVYSTYEQQMRFISNKVWSADSETLQDLQAALQQTGAYRFPDTIASPADLSSPLVNTESA